MFREAVAGTSGDWLAGCVEEPEGTHGLQCHPLAPEPASPGGGRHPPGHLEAPGPWLGVASLGSSSSPPSFNAGVSNLSFLKKFLNTGVLLIYNIVYVAGVQPRDLVLNVYVYGRH